MRMFFVLATVAFLLMACSPTPATPIPPTEAFSPSAVPPTSTPKPATATPQPTTTATPHVNPAAVLEKWEPLVSGAGLTVAAYQYAFRVADGLEDGDIGGADAFGHMLGAGVILSAASEALKVWEADSQQLAFREAIISQADSGIDGIGGWMNGEIQSAEEFHTALDEAFRAAQTTQADVTAAARAAGLSDAQLEQIARDIDTTMAELEEAMEGEAS